MARRIAKKKKKDPLPMCENCLYSTEVSGMRTCRRFPQTLIKRDDEWCGEYSRRPEKKDAD